MSALTLWRAETATQLDRALANSAAAATAAEDSLSALATKLLEQAISVPSGGCSVAIVATDHADLTAKIATARAAVAAEERVHSGDGLHVAITPLTVDCGPAFLFPGQGSQTVGMGAALAASFPEAQAAFAHADAVLAAVIGRPLSELIFAPADITDDDLAARQAALTATDVAQPALGATELAYLAVLDRLGVKAAMTAGHSYGEFTALHAAGVISAADLLLLSEARGRFMRAGSAGGDPGGMAAIGSGPQAIAELLAADSELVAANFNGPRQTVIAGSSAAIERALNWCKDNGLRAQRLAVACAFHSPYVAPAKEQLATVLQATDFRPPDRPVYSNTTAARHADEPETIVATLCKHLVEPVRFTEQLVAMHDAGARIFLEVGPKTVLTSLTKRILGKQREHIAVAVDRGDGIDGLLGAIATLWTEGVPIAVERLLD